MANRLLKIGDRAPDLELQRAGGKPIQLSSFWSKGPAVLVFLRHSG